MINKEKVSFAWLLGEYYFYFGHGDPPIPSSDWELFDIEEGGDNNLEELTGYKVIVRKRTGKTGYFVAYCNQSWGSFGEDNPPHFDKTEDGFVEVIPVRQRLKPVWEEV